MTEECDYSLVGTASFIFWRSVDHTRSLFVLGQLSWVHCYKNMAQSDFV